MIHLENNKWVAVALFRTLAKNFYYKEIAQESYKINQFAAQRQLWSHITFIHFQEILFQSLSWEKINSYKLNLFNKGNQQQGSIVSGKMFINNVDDLVQM